MNVARSRWLRWAVPAAAVGLVVGGAQLTAWAATSPGDLPTITARDLLVKAQQARVDQLSGTVRSTTSLGLPALPSGRGANWSSLVAGTQTLRVFADGPQRQRVDLMGDLAQASVVHDAGTVWTWSSETREVTKATLPAKNGTPNGSKHPLDRTSATPLTPQEAADQALSAISPTTDVSVGRNAKVAGRAAYDLRLVPRDAATLVGSVDLYVDAKTGIALRAVVVPRGSREAAVDVGFTSLRLSAPAASTFHFTAPPGSTVRDVTVPNAADRVSPAPTGKAPDVQQVGSGWSSVLVAAGVQGDDLTQQLSGAAAGSGARGDTGPGIGPALLQAARPVHGAFGSGRVLRTRLASVLLTDDGRVLVGAVTPAELVRVASLPAAQAR
ncbi:LolA family protein [Angustibacter sp. McL0619]|uniref:LolA family protein n=1 Tax=Angustibacter sp. McL0619 TaxID=3415676 RepID=UPI003CE6D350